MELLYTESPNPKFGCPQWNEIKEVYKQSLNNISDSLKIKTKCGF